MILLLLVACQPSGVCEGVPDCVDADLDGASGDELVVGRLIAQAPSRGEVHAFAVTDAGPQALGHGTGELPVDHLGGAFAAVDLDGDVAIGAPEHRAAGVQAAGRVYVLLDPSL